MIEKPLWVTSFQNEMYQVSGKALIKSFHEYKVEGDLYIGKENHIPNFMNKHGDIVVQIDESPFITQFMCDHRAVIPESLGGLAKPCNCGHPKKHKKGCRNTWWCRNAFRWFRKAVTLYYAFEYTKNTDHTAIVWIDADCVFNRFLPATYIDNQFNLTSSFHMLGKRKHSETSLIGFNLKTRGRELFDMFLSRYVSGRFREDVRWDDCWQYDLTRKEASELSPAIECNDIAEDTDTGNVLTKIALGQFIYHDKGRHGRKLGIMK